MIQLADWQTFLAVQAGAAATLTGLVFVAVSINLTRIISVSGLSGRAFEALLQLLQIFFISSLALVPQQAAQVLASEILCVSFVSLMGQLFSTSRYARQRAGHPRSWLVSRLIMTALSTLPFCACGLMLLFGSATWIDVLVVGTITSFISAVLGAWILLVEILR